MQVTYRRPCITGPQTRRPVLHLVRANCQRSQRKETEQLYGERRPRPLHADMVHKYVHSTGHPVFVCTADRRESHVPLRECSMHWSSTRRIETRPRTLPLGLRVSQVNSGSAEDGDTSVASMLDDRVDTLFKLIHVGTFMTSTQVCYIALTLRKQWKRVSLGLPWDCFPS